VIEAMREFSKEKYHVDVLKVEVPVNIDYVEGFNGDNDAVYTKDEALNYFKEQSDVTELPYIFLSAGVPARLLEMNYIWLKKLVLDSTVSFAEEQLGRSQSNHLLKKVTKSVVTG
jgi:Tagatose-1,6-bisphosphate aldolase